MAATLTEMETEIAGLKKQLAERKAPQRPEITKATAPAEPADAALVKSFGFGSLGEFAKEVVKSRKNGSVTPLLGQRYSHETVVKAATGMGELVGSDGGFLVPPQFASAIFERVYAEQNLLAKTDQYTVTGNSMVFPRNAESTRATGSRWGGVRAYWVQEGDTITASKPTFGRLELQLHKLACLARVTSELLEDSGTALGTYLNRVFPAEISFLANNAIYRGTGAGQPLGLLNADCRVEVAKETGQPAATILPANIEKMWARRFKGAGGGNYAWFINQDVTPQLGLMHQDVGTGGQLVYMPPGGLSAAPYATLKGAPVMEIEFASTLGTVGDIALVDLSQYVTISKGGMNSEVSMHLYFDTDEQAFRVTFRLDGQPWWPSALTPFQGSNTQSPVILLATRS